MKNCISLNEFYASLYLFGATTAMARRQQPARRQQAEAERPDVAPGPTLRPAHVVNHIGLAPLFWLQGPWL